NRTEKCKTEKWRLLFFRLTFFGLVAEPTIIAAWRANRLFAYVYSRARRLGQNVERELNFILKLEQTTGDGDRADVEIGQSKLESAPGAQFISLKLHHHFNRKVMRHAVQ